PPATFTRASKRAAVWVTLKGWVTMPRRTSVGKYFSKARPLITIFPEPVASRTRATAVLRRPVAMNSGVVVAAMGTLGNYKSNRGKMSRIELKSVGRFQNGGLLRRMRVIGPLVNFEFGQE